MLFLLLALAIVSCWALAEGVLKPGRSAIRAALAGEALLCAAASVYLALYVAGEDDYRHNGMSRWEAYDARGLTAAAIACGVVVSLFAALVASRPARRFLPALGLGGLVAAGLSFVAYFANTLN